MRDWASFPLRIGLGIVFVAHGLQKALGMFGGSGIDGFSQMLSGSGFPSASILAYIVAYIELIGGACLILGLFTRLAALLIAIVMIVAMWKIHFAKGLFLANGGFEYNLVIISACISLIIFGSGKLGITKKL